LTDNTGTPGSESLARTDADDSISAPGGDDVIYGGGLDSADLDGPIMTTTLSTNPDADSSTPGEQPDRVLPPCHQKNNDSREPRSKVLSFNIRGCELERHLS
jgi:hypothetical protein